MLFIDSWDQQWFWGSCFLWTLLLQLQILAFYSKSPSSWCFVVILNLAPGTLCISAPHSPGLSYLRSLPSLFRSPVNAWPFNQTFVCSLQSYGVSWRAFPFWVSGVSFTWPIQDQMTSLDCFAHISKLTPLQSFFLELSIGPRMSWTEQNTRLISFPCNCTHRTNIFLAFLKHQVLLC